MNSTSFKLLFKLYSYFLYKTLNKNRIVYKKMCFEKDIRGSRLKDNLKG